MPISQGLGRLRLILIILVVFIMVFTTIITVNRRIEIASNSIKGTSAHIAEVTGVIDGDTFFIRGGEKVRLICVDAPEFGDSGYWEAKAFLEDKIKWKNVTLVKDVSEKDSYGRLLRYVYFNHTFINELLVKEGLAKPFPYGNDTSLCPAIEEAAKKNKNQEGSN